MTYWQEIVAITLTLTGSEDHKSKCWEKEKNWHKAVSVVLGSNCHIRNKKLKINQNHKHYLRFKKLTIYYFTQNGDGLAGKKRVSMLEQLPWEMGASVSGGQKYKRVGWHKKPITLININGCNKNLFPSHQVVTPYLLVRMIVRVNVVVKFLVFLILFITEFTVKVGSKIF